MLPDMWLLLAGCVVEGRDDWEILPISRAWFEDFDKSSVAIVGGVLAGDAMLAWDGPYGPGAMPVRLGGGTLGLAFSFMGDLEGHDGIVPIDLSRVTDPTVADVLGTYKGSGVAGGVLIGGARGRARNGRGASFQEDHFALGLGFWGGFEWLVVRPASGEQTLTTPYDTGIPYNTPYTPYTIDTGTPYTTPYTPPVEDTAAETDSPPPSSEGDASGGCGGGDKEDEDTGSPSSPSSGSSSPSTTTTVRSCDHTGGARLWTVGLFAALVASRRRSSARG
jgi:hypothetical protein